MADYVINPDRLNALDPDTLVGGARTVAGHVAAGVTDIAAVPTALYGMAGSAVRGMPDVIPFFGPVAGALRSMLSSSKKLPGEDAAHEITDAVRKFSLEFGSDIAGRNIVPGLMGENSVADKIGTGASIATNMIPITGGPIMGAMKAAKSIDTGVKAIDKTVPVLVEAASFLSPLVPTLNPKTLIAANMGIGGALTLAADIANPPKMPQKHDPELAGIIDQFKTQWAVVNDALDTQAKDASDIATDGVGQLYDSKKDADTQKAIAEFQTVDWSNTGDVESKKQKVIHAGVPDLGDYQGAALGVLGIATAAGIAYNKRLAIRNLIGGPEFDKTAARASGMVSQPDSSKLGVFDTFGAQAVDAALPARRASLKPEEIGARFEGITSAFNVQSEAMLRDGVLRYSNVKFARPVEGFVRDVQEKIASDPTKYKAFVEAANDMSESNNRVRAWLEGTKPAAVGTRNVGDPILIGEYTSWLARERQKILATPGPKQQHLLNELEKKYAFEGVDTVTNTVKPFSDLLTTRRAAMADPVMGPLLTEYKDITKKLGLDYRLEQGVITKKMHRDLSNLHPDYFPVRIQGQHMSKLNLSSTGGRLQRGDPIMELFPYIQETVQDVAHQKMKRALIMELRDRKRIGDKAAMDLLGRDDIFSQNHYNEGKMVTYVDYKGNSRMIEVTDPMLRMSLQPGAGTAALRLNAGMIKAFAFPSRVLEALTTGPTTAIVGAPFAIGNAAYGTSAILYNRPVGTVAGHIDKIVQDYISKPMGMKFGFRGDPTFVAAVAAQMLPNVLAVLSKSAAAALESTVRSNSWFARAVGPGTLDTAAKAMSNFYKASMVHALEQHGLYGGATPMTRTVVPTMQDLEAALTPAAKLSKGWSVTRNFAHDLLGAIGNAQQHTYFKQNMGRLSEGMLTSRTRNVMGDPAKAGLGKSGIGKFAVEGTITLPWGGVTVQSFSRFAHAIRTNPHGTAAAIGATVAMPSILATNWNASLGPEYTDYQYNKRTPDQVSGSHYVGIPGQPPEEGLEIRIDQLMRPFKVLTDIIYGSQLGLLDGSLFAEGNEDLRKMFQDTASTRYGLFGDAMKSSIAQVLPAVPPAINAFTGAMGFDSTTRSFVDKPTKVMENKARGATDSTARYTDSKLFGYDISAENEAMFSTLGGQIGRAILTTIQSGQQASKDGLTPGEYAKDYGDRFMMNLEQSSREVSGLWGHAATISPSQEAASKALQAQMEGIKKLSDASQKMRSLQGTGSMLVGAKGREVDALVGSGPVPFKDEQMMALARAAQVFETGYNRMYAGHLKDLYEQRNSIQSSEKVSPRVKQVMINDVSKQIVETNRDALKVLKQWNWNVSKTFGKDIDLQKIQLDEPITQFKPLL